MVLQTGFLTAHKNRSSLSQENIEDELPALKQKIGDGERKRQFPERNEKTCEYIFFCGNRIFRAI